MVFEIILILAFIGYLLSAYAFYIEKRKEKEERYKAVCDIGEHASCTKAFTSAYGKMFGISNSIYGMLFYVLVFILALLNFGSYIFYLSVLSFLETLYLAYILYFKLKNFCLICHGIYLINILLLVFSWKFAFWI